LAQGLSSVLSIRAGKLEGIMLRWLTKDSKNSKNAEAFGSIAEGLQKLYREKLLPVEKEHDFADFHGPELTDAEFQARPMVLLLGQYSTGKSTFIRHLLGRDYPGLHIGPEPTTDKFVAVCHDNHDQVIPGNALVVDKSLPFTALAEFGNSFLGRFECSKCNSKVLEGITLIDTPGVLAGEKQRVNRGYEFEKVVQWFASRVDMILVLFDVSKLDISDEFRRVLLALKGNDSKIHIVLNKADRVTTPQLMRVYGALMWSLGKVINTPEVTRVYIGSFWDEPLHNDEQRKLFESEAIDLYHNLNQLPRGAAVRKLNDLIKRARLAKVHAYILVTLKEKMPSMFGKAKEQEKLRTNLPTIYAEIAKVRQVPVGDFPDAQIMSEKLKSMDFSKFKKIDLKKLSILETMLSTDLPRLLQLVPAEMEKATPAQHQAEQANAPFATSKAGGLSEASTYQNEWLRAPPNVEDYRKDFEKIDINGTGKISGGQAKDMMVQSKLPSNVLHKIWTLADVDKDGALTVYEFSLAMHFIKMRLDGQDLPPVLPAHLACPMSTE